MKEKPPICYRPRIVDSRDIKVAEPINEQCISSEREGNENFSEEEIINKIKFIAEKRAIKLNNLEIAKRVTDNQRNIVFLRIKGSVNENNEIKNKVFEFMLEGRHRTENGDYITDKTNIADALTYEELDKYEEGKWSSDIEDNNNHK